jgi:hypothetical protein
MTDVLYYRTLEERYSRLTSELRLTTSYLKIHPKVYWIWTHRKWCLEHIPEGPGRTSSLDVPPSSNDSEHREAVNGVAVDQAENPVIQNGSAEESISAESARTEGTQKQGEEEEENDTEGWKKEAWGRELMLVEKMLEADSRNCECQCVEFLCQQLISFTAHLLPSPCMGLQTLRVIFSTANCSACENTTNGSQIYNQED